MITPSENYFNLGNTKTMTKMLFKNSIKNTTNRELQKAFNDKKMLLPTRQSKKLRNLLVRAKFESKTIPKSPKLTRLFLCSNCVYHKAE